MDDIYLTEAEKRDKEVVEDLKGDADADKILVFVTPGPAYLVHTHPG